jgi:hypothetical protein
MKRRGEKGMKEREHKTKSERKIDCAKQKNGRRRKPASNNCLLGC